MGADLLQTLAILLGRMRAMTELRYRRLGPRRWVWFARRDGRWEREREDKLSPEERRRAEELLEEFNAAPESGRGEESQL